MPFVAVTLFLFIYYIRPQEWIGFFSTISPVRMVMIFGLVSLLTRFRGLSWRDLLQTPHDWLLLIFFGYVIYHAPDGRYAFDSLLQYIIFYVVIVQALSSISAIQSFLNVWATMIMVVAALAVLSTVGFDPMGSYDITQWQMKGRLVLNTSIFNNPNALGHSVVLVIPMLFYCLVWKRPIFVKELFFLVVPLPIYCVYLTASKGAFLAGFATLVISLTSGFPRWLQLLLVAAALSGSMAGLQKLPRMETLDKSEAGIEGRIHAFEMGWQAMQRNKYGLGYEQWWNYMIDRSPEWVISTHSSYNKIGAELGKPGLFLYLGLLFVAFRTAYMAKTQNDDEERIRRLLITLIISFAISSWMIDWAYRATLFMTVATAAAFHRQLLRQRREVSLDDEAIILAEEARAAQRSKIRRPVPLSQPGGAGSGDLVIPGAAVLSRMVASIRGPGVVGIKWNRLGLIDLAAIFVLLQMAFYIWRRAITTFF